MNKTLLSTMVAMASAGMSLNAQSLIDEDFESGKGSWSSRGGETVAVSKEAAHSGMQSLKVSSRSDYWNGASVKSADFKAGESYDVEAYVYFDGSTYKPAASFDGEVIPLKLAYPEETYFKFGTCLNGGTVSSLRNMCLTHFNSVTPENELKPDATLNQSASQQRGNNVNPQVQLSSGAKSILKFCQDNKIGLRGHCFVWHSQTPTWLFKENFSSNGSNVSVSIMDQRLENYIKNVFDAITSAYPNLNLYAFDVVNEAFNEDGTLRSAGDNSISPGQSYWYQIYKSNDYIKKAFRFARKYAPKGCKLYYNDYNEYNSSKRDGIYKLVKEMFEEGICDGVGMQSHLDVTYPGMQLYEQAIQKYASIGCDIQITELDVTSSNGESPQGPYYKSCFELYKKYKDNISAVVVWGINDANSWRGDRIPLLFDKNNNPKEAYKQIVAGMNVSSQPSQDEDTELKELPFQLCFQYNDGTTQYPTIEKVTVPSKTWTKLSGLMEVPADAEDISVYVQTSDNGADSDLIDFYVDDVKCSLFDPTAVSNTAAEGGYLLLQNTPNPAVEHTAIRFALPVGGQVAISLYNAAGVKVSDIVNENLSEGSYIKDVDVKNLVPGVYFYEMSVNGISLRKAMIVK